MPKNYCNPESFTYNEMAEMLSAIGLPVVAKEKSVRNRQSYSSYGGDARGLALPQVVINTIPTDEASDAIDIGGAQLSLLLMLVKSCGCSDDMLSEWPKTLAEKHLINPVDDFMIQQAMDVAINYTPGKYPSTDLGLRDYFLDLHHKSLRYCRDNKKLYAFGNGLWIENKSDYIDRLVRDLIKANRNIVLSIKDDERIAIDLDKFDSNSWLLNLKNGTYDLKQDTFRDHMPSDHMTMMAPVIYDPQADCPNFKKMVTDAFEDDAETIDYVQRFLGYCLTGDTAVKRFFVFYGPGSNNGKSTLLRVMRSVLGGNQSTG